MANLSIATPFESEKSSDLHDRSNRPPAPKLSRMESAWRWGVIADGVILSVGATALLFSLRASWDNHREWLVTLIPFLVIAAVAVVYLVARKQAIALAPGLLFLFLSLIFGGADVLLDAEEGSDTARDVLSILGGICLGLSVAFLIGALIWVEARNPTKAPAPEL
jgi:hypothetical protein